MRPTLPKHKRRTKTIGIRVNQSERRAIEEKAEIAGRTVTEYGRAVLLNHHIGARPEIPKANFEMLDQLSKIGANLNQCMKAVNRRQSDMPMHVLVDLQRQINDLRAALVPTQEVSHS